MLHDRGVPQAGYVTGVLVRLALATLILVPLAGVWGTLCIDTLLPALRIVFCMLGSDFRVLHFGVVHDGADTLLRVEVTLRHTVVLGAKILYPDPRGTANASTLIGHAFQGPLVAIIFATAWPARRSREFAWRLLVLLPLLLALVLFDMPCVLAGELWNLMTDTMAPGTVSPLVLCKDFLQGGGRFALGLAAGAASILLRDHQAVQHDAAVKLGGSRISRRT